MLEPTDVGGGGGGGGGGDFLGLPGLLVEVLERRPEEEGEAARSGSRRRGG